MKSKKENMKKITHFNFTLVLHGVNEKTEGLEDALFEEGCDDSLINFRNGAVYLDFDRASDNLEEAVISAIKQVESLPYNITVVSVSPDDYVSESEVAKRLHINRQAVSLWFKGERHIKNPFPSPVMKLSEKSPLWRWSDVVEWLYQKKKITDYKILEQAKFMSSLNVALMARDTDSKQLQNKIQKKLKAG